MTTPKMVMTDEIRHAMIRAKQRCDAGIISELEAGIEQLEALLIGNPLPGGHALAAALRAYQAGDETALRRWLGKTP